MDKCTYCGHEYGLEREHVIPAHWLGSKNFVRTKSWIVTSCKQCNSLAGAYVAFSVPEKAKFILKRYRSKFRKYLRTPIWTEKELSELEYKFKVMIEESLVVKQLILTRIEHLRIVSEYSEGYLRPDWVEEEMKSAIADYRRMIKSLRRKKRKK